MFINAKCGKNATEECQIWIQSGKLELERDRDAAEFSTTCVTSRFSNPETSVVPPFCEFFLFFFSFLHFFNVKVPFRCLSPQTEEAEACPHHQESHLCLSNNNKQTYKQISFGL